MLNAKYNIYIFCKNPILAHDQIYNALTQKFINFQWLAKRAAEPVPFIQSLPRRY